MQRHESLYTYYAYVFVGFPCIDTLNLFTCDTACLAYLEIRVRVSLLMIRYRAMGLSRHPRHRRSSLLWASSYMLLPSHGLQATYYVPWHLRKIPGFLQMIFHLFLANMPRVDRIRT